MDPTIVKALALIEDHHVEHGIPTVLEMRGIRAKMEAEATGHATAVEMAHDTLTAMGYRVEMVDGVIYRLEQ
ncbi:hypothetical protein MKK88_14895 [Methylobacterium sp. E-005]|uniref:hypothetical protein n=1 Tax=Methylobacterium sp. E-005 TaxID=2836549 RepID=UPI001FB968EB|nr:hypothetical protein [Methylobacterium sp. E-005]MCJ2087262.1 hypothetical protein [Methylobacterium sp. E-005]